MTVENYNFDKNTNAILVAYFEYKNYVLNLYFAKEQSARKQKRDNVIGMWKIKKIK